MRRALHDLSLPVFVVKQDDGWAIGTGGTATFGPESADGLPVIAYAPAMRVSQLGDASFCADHGIRFACMTGAMANGIASTDVVIAAARAGCLGSFGAAGLRLPQIDAAIDRLQRELPELPFCFNLIHSPNEMSHEMRVVELYLQRRVRLVEAAAFLDLTLPAVLYRVTGIHRGADGEVVAPNRIIAKVSRVEVATKWFSPPPAKMLTELVAMGKITAEQADMAAGIPMAQDLTAEADSAGHTDNRPALTLLPTMLALRDRLQQQFEYDLPLRVGLGGGIGTPAAAAAAFAMGAAYIVTGSVNQACVESGSSDKVRGMLAQVQQADVIMAPAADMFEMGVKLQVIKRGTMFPMRAAKLYELYRAYGSIEEIPPSEREAVEKTIFREPLLSIWEKTKAFFREIDPSHIERAERDPKHKMALVFRWYLGLSSRWANAGDASRVVDYQVWCGPAMGAFNEWTKGTFLEEPGNRRVGVVAMNLLHGAAVTTRLNALRSQGVRMDAELARVAPVLPTDIEEQLR
ncbi:MAG TPA: PfaD family polyunsaturated fatty acid/polyketide biosynthesis protein [Phycisphaerae bacterium]|nr:PfaD family polyunsaturated fatty acid/polyketide biosynthesis protein [Phycisphaerae bacterium]